MFCPIFASLHPKKSPLHPFSLLGTYASTLYIGKRLKAYYLPFAAVFVFARQKVSVLPFEYLCSRFRVLYVCQYYLQLLVRLQPSFFCFRFHSLFVSRNLCVKHYASFVCLCKFNMYIYARYYDKQKTLREFQTFLPFRCKRTIFLLFVSLLFLSFWIICRKQKQKRKKPHFCRFCPKTSVFVANKVLIFSDLWVYRVNCTLPPPFLSFAGWVSSRPNFFLFFLFFIFCKIL